MSRLRTSAPRYRRRIFTLGMIAALVLFCIGFPIFNNRIEADLERRVPTELAEAGYPGITATFSGQDGTLRCAEPLTDPEGATEAAYDVWGVRKVTLDRLCRVNRAPTVDDGDSSGTDTASGTSADDTAESGTGTTVGAAQFATIAEAVAGDPQLSFLGTLLDESGSSNMLGNPENPPVTLFAPTDDAFDDLPADVTAQLRSDPDLLATVLAHHIVDGSVLAADLTPGALTMMDGTVSTVAIDGTAITIDDAAVVRPDVVTGNGVVHIVDRVLLPADFAADAEQQAAAVSATLAEGSITLAGVVASEVERVTLIDTATTAAGDGNVIDQLTVDPDTGLAGELTGQLASLIAPMPETLVSGVAGFDGAALYLNGVAVDEVAATNLGAIADALGVDVDLEVRPTADAEEAEELETDLNETVTANPIRFEPNSAVLTADAGTVLDDLADQVLAVGGVSITVEGHTDSDGDAAGNQVLSQQRAEAVRQALVERGVAAGSITAQGFGEQQPVLVGGVEDKEASRRVEFRIEATA